MLNDNDGFTAPLPAACGSCDEETFSSCGACNGTGYEKCTRCGERHGDAGCADVAAAVERERAESWARRMWAEMGRAA